ncbi:hypothetical protein BaRGS_00006864 [Batillaria attramentaria]|uniref:Uncharacterized protein n=1 Tax=Batillaria attramentaria TaxID=370345 RepID=A0ABD0LRK1_9CAEN
MCAGRGTRCRAYPYTPSPLTPSTPLLLTSLPPSRDSWPEVCDHFCGERGKASSLLAPAVHGTSRGQGSGHRARRPVWHLSEPPGAMQRPSDKWRNFPSDAEMSSVSQKPATCAQKPLYCPEYEDYNDVGLCDSDWAKYSNDMTATLIITVVHLWSFSSF